MLTLVALGMKRRFSSSLSLRPVFDVRDVGGREWGCFFVALCLTRAIGRASSNLSVLIGLVFIKCLKLSTSVVWKL